MKLLFLDFDGVLNSLAFLKSDRTIDWHATHLGHRSDWEKEADRALDPLAIYELNRIVETTGCKIVVSSSWRKMFPLPILGRQLKHRGFTGRHLLGATPSLEVAPEENYSKEHRGREIAAYLELFPAGVIKKFAIVDDDSDMWTLTPYFVKTDNTVGLTVEKADEIIALLQ